MSLQSISKKMPKRKKSRPVPTPTHRNSFATDADADDDCTDEEVTDINTSANLSVNKSTVVTLSSTIYSEPFDSLQFPSRRPVPPVTNRNTSEPNIYSRVSIEEASAAALLRGIKFPVFTPPNSPSQRPESYRFSRYDNLDLEFIGLKSDDMFLEDDISKPWDSSKWEHLLKIVSDPTSTMQLDVVRIKKENIIIWQTIQCIVRELSEDSSGIFGPSLKTFIACTLAAKSKDPQKIMQNTRQFMNGMKNYLTATTTISSLGSSSSGSQKDALRREIKNQILLLDEPESEFCELALDLALEEVLIELILEPLYTYIIDLLQETNTNTDTTDYDLPTSSSTTNTNSNKNKDEVLNGIYNEFKGSSSPLFKLQKLREFVFKVQMDHNHEVTTSSIDIDVDQDHDLDHNSVEILAGALTSLGAIDLKPHVDYTLALLPQPQSMHQSDKYILSLVQNVAEYLRIGKYLES